MRKSLAGDSQFIFPLKHKKSDKGSGMALFDGDSEEQAELTAANTEANANANRRSADPIFPHPRMNTGYCGRLINSFVQRKSMFNRICRVL